MKLIYSQTVKPFITCFLNQLAYRLKRPRPADTLNSMVYNPGHSVAKSPVFARIDPNYRTSQHVDN